MMAMCLATVALYPDAGAIGVVFLFPDRDGGFDGIDDGAAGIEGSVAVSCRDGDGNGDFTDFKMPSCIQTIGM